MFTHFAFLDLSTVDLVIILVIILLIFGAKKLPELSRSLGESARELRKGLSSDEQNKNKQTDSNQNNSQS